MTDRQIKRQGVFELSKREQALVELVADGKSNRDIAEILQIAVGTVRSTLNRAFDKLGVSNRVGAARWWWERSRKPEAPQENQDGTKS